MIIDIGPNLTVLASLLLVVLLIGLGMKYDCSWRTGRAGVYQALGEYRPN